LLRAVCRQKPLATSRRVGLFIIDDASKNAVFDDVKYLTN